MKSGGILCTSSREVLLERCFCFGLFVCMLMGSLLLIFY